MGYSVNLSPPYPACSIVPAGNYNVNIRNAPGTTSPIVGTLLPAAWISVSRLTNGWYQVSYPGTPVHNAWVSSSVVNLTPPCTCTETSCSQNQPPPPPNCVARTTTLARVYSTLERNVGITILTQLGAGATVNVLGQVSGWYSVQVSSTISGWISSASATLSGSCNNVIVSPIGQNTALCIVGNLTNQVGTVSPAPGDTTNLSARFQPQTGMGAISQYQGWIEVYIPGFDTRGWLQSSPYVLDGLCNSLPITYAPGATQTPVPIPFDACYISNTSGADQPVYERPDPASAIIGTLPPFDTLMPTMSGRSGTWVEISMARSPGWVDGRYLTFTGAC